MHPHRITCKVWDLIQVLGWDPSDDIVVEVGGSVVGGIHQGENANPKWTREFGVKSYNKDAFLVIKNRSRTPFEPSKAPE